MKVSSNIIEEELVFLKKRELIIVTGAGEGIGGYVNMDFDITSKGRARAQEISMVRPYVGPLPVSVEEYKEVCRKPREINSQSITIDKLNNIFKEMILNSSYFSKIGPAINSGGPILFYGKPGNGKTMIAEKVIQAFSDEIYVPYCLMVDGQFIKCFDEKFIRLSAMKL